MYIEHVCEYAQKSFIQHIELQFDGTIFDRFIHVGLFFASTLQRFSAFDFYFSSLFYSVKCSFHYDVSYSCFDILIIFSEHLKIFEYRVCIQLQIVAEVLNVYKKRESRWFVNIQRTFRGIFFTWDLNELFTFGMSFECVRCFLPRCLSL